MYPMSSPGKRVQASHDWIGWKRGASFCNQSQSLVQQNQGKYSKLKTGLPFYVQLS